MKFVVAFQSTERKYKKNPPADVYSSCKAYPGANGRCCVLCKRESSDDVQVWGGNVISGFQRVSQSVY